MDLQSNNLRRVVVAAVLIPLILFQLNLGIFVNYVQANPLSFPLETQSTEEVLLENEVDLSSETEEVDVAEEGNVSSMSTSLEGNLETFYGISSGIAYKYALDSNVSILFSNLPEGNNWFSIEEINVVVDGETIVGYEFLTNMVNGTFDYSLGLPNTHGDDAIVQYSEDGLAFEELVPTAIDTEKIVLEADHFTIFVVINPLPVGTTNGDLCTIASINGNCYDSLQLAINAATAGDTVEIQSNLTTYSQITVAKSLTINGNGFTLFGNFTKTNNSNNSILGINGTSTFVTVNNLVIDGTSGVDLHGVNAYLSNVTLDNLTIQNNQNTALNINGASVIVNNLTTSGNATRASFGTFYSYNVIELAQGSGVTKVPTLTVNGQSKHSETQGVTNRRHINIKAGSVTDTNNQYTVSGANRILKSAPVTPSLSVLVSNDVDANLSWNVVSYAASYNYEISLSGTIVRSGNTTNLNVTELSLEDGNYEARVQAVAASGLASNWSNVAEFTITVPIQLYTTLEIGGLVNNTAGNIFTLSGDAYADNGLNRVYVQLVHRETSLRYGGTTINLIPEGNTASWSREYNVAELGLPEGTYAAHAQLVDMLGGRFDIGWTEDFKIDRTMPAFEILTPLNGSTVSGVQRMSVRITDESGIYKVLMNVGDGRGNYVWEEGKTSSLSRDGDIFYVDIDTNTLPEGQNFIVVRGTDGVGNTRYWNNNPATRSHSYFVDNTLPSLWVKGASWGNVYTPTSLGKGNTFREVSFKLFDAQRIDKVTINGTEKNLTNATWTDVNFVKPGSDGAIEGNNTIVVYDVAGNTTTYNFILDTTAPTLTVKPSPDTVGGSFDTYSLVSFKLYDLYKIDKVSINGIDKDLSDNQYSDVNGVRNGVFGAVEGNNTIVVYDVAGNTTTYEFIVDNTRPTLEVLHPLTEDEFLTSDIVVKALDNIRLNRVTINIYKDGGNTVFKSCSVNISADNLTEYVFTCDVSDLEDGRYYFKTNASDVAGNPISTTITRSFLIDTTLPVTTLSSPTSNSVWSEAITISGTTTDENGVSKVFLDFSIAGENDWSSITEILNESGTSPFNWTYSWTPSEERTYDIRARAADTAGNVENTDYAYSVTYDATNPVAPIDLRLTVRSTNTDVANGFATNKSDVTAKWSNPNTEDVTFTYFYWNDISSSAYNVSNKWSSDRGTALEYAGNVNQGEGSHFYCVEATDLAGNKSGCSDTFEFIFDATRPTVSVEDYDIAEGMLSVDLSATDDRSGLLAIGLNIYDQDNNVRVLPLIGRVANNLSFATLNHSITKADIDVSSLEAGTYTIRAVSLDHAGNYSHQTLVQFTIEEESEFAKITVVKQLTDEEGIDISSEQQFEVRLFDSEDNIVETEGAMYISDNGDNSLIAEFNVVAGEYYVAETPIDGYNLLGCYALEPSDSFSVLMYAVEAMTSVSNHVFAIENGEELTIICQNELISEDENEEEEETGTENGGNNGNNNPSNPTQPNQGGAGPVVTQTGNVAGESTSDEDEEEIDTSIFETGSVRGVSALVCDERFTVSGTIFSDLNGNESKDGDEVGISGVLVQIYYTENGEEVIVAEETTSANGRYDFEICPGTYNVRISENDIPDGYQVLGSTTREVNVDDSQVENFNFVLVNLNNNGINWWIIAIILILVVGGAGIYFYSNRRED